MNETWTGLAADGNLESVDVACSWLGGRDARACSRGDLLLEDLWANIYPGLDVRPFPQTARDALVAAADSEWESTIERLLQGQADEPASEETERGGCKGTDAQATPGSRTRGVARQRPARHSRLRDRGRKDVHRS